MKKYMWTIDNWGADYPPENASEIIERANGLISRFIENNPYCGDDEISAFSADLWERYCSGGVDVARIKIE